MTTPNNNTALAQVKGMLLSIPRKRLILMGATALGIGLAIFAFAYFKRSGDYRTLYKSMSPEDAGVIVAKLKEKEIPFRVSDDGATIAVPQEKLGELRLELAAAGLPKTGRIGFELFDQTKFGATDFMEHVNYRRALEGELERTMASMGEIEQARVHLTFAKDSVFTENRLPAKGSVVLKLRAAIPEQTINAIRYLVSNAVEGLTPEAVSIVDMKGNLLGKSKQKAASEEDESSVAALDYRRNIEKDLLTKINTTLEPLLGPERFRSSVAAECDFTSGELSEETYDPQRQAIISDQRSKETTSAGATTGVPGTQSNLPRATPRPGTNTQVTRESQTTSYQTTRTIKRTKLPQGTLKRLSVSVLVDHTPHWEGRGPTLRRVLTPPTQETLNRITEVVSAAVGIVTERGDRLVVDSLPFESTQDEQPPAALREQAPAPESQLNTKYLMTAVAIASVLLAAFVVVRSHKLAHSASAPPYAAHALPSPEMNLRQAIAGVTPVPTTAQLKKEMEGQRNMIEEDRRKELEATGAALKQLADNAVEMAQTNTELCAGVLRTWLNEKPENVS